MWQLHEFSGDCFERGQAYGRHCIEHHPSTAQQMLDDMRAKRDALNDRGRRLLQHVCGNVSERMPQLYREMEGMAVGAYLPAEDVLALNMRNAWTCDEFMADEPEVEAGCSAVLIANEGRPILFKTLDDAVLEPVEEAGWLEKIDTMLAD